MKLYKKYTTYWWKECMEALHRNVPPAIFSSQELNVMQLTYNAVLAGTGHGVVSGPVIDSLEQQIGTSPTFSWD